MGESESSTGVASSSTTSDESFGSSVSTSGSTPGGTSIDGSESTSSSSGDSTGPIQAGYCLETAAFPVSVAANALADVDGDGAQEVWAHPTAFSLPEAETVRAHRVTGLELDINAFSFEAPGDGYWFADIDGDGRDDLVRFHEGAYAFHSGQDDLSVTEQANPLPSFRPPYETSFVDIDEDGDDDVVTLSADDAQVLVVWRNNAGTFSLHGSTELTTSAPMTVAATPVAGSTWLAIELNLGTAQRPFLLLDVADGVDVLHQSEQVFVYGSYVDDEGPAILANEDGMVTRLRWNGASLERDDTGIEGTTTGVLGTYDGLPMLLVRHDDDLVLVDLTTDDPLPLTVTTPSTIRAPWRRSGIGSDGQLFFQNCSLAYCELELGVLSPC